MSAEPVGHYAWLIVDADDTPTPRPDDHLSLATRAEAFAELADLDDEVALQVSPDVLDDGDGATELEMAPPVVLVVVVRNADAWLDDMLTSLGEQTYSNLSILVIDAASDIDPTPRVARVLPGAFVRRLESNVGFGPTVNEILDLVSGASFFCICHDDVALDPDCVHELVAEAFRSNAGIVGPKAVAWDDPERLLSVGFTVDRSGGRAPYAEVDELDQGQHDAVRDVFAVTGGCTLVRSDLFEHLGGFDPGIDLVGEDLDLCWRAHLVGARVVVAPGARIRHRRALAERIDPARLLRMDAAHRIRTVLVNYRLGHLVMLLPLLAFVTIVEAIVEIAIRRRGHARALLRGWGTNLRSVRSVVRARRRVRAIRETNDRSIARLQTRTWARLEGVIQANRRARQDGSQDVVAIDSELPGATVDDVIDDAERDSFVRTGRARRSYSLVTWGVIALVVLVVIGTRELFFGTLPPIGTFADPPSGLADLWRSWLQDWNPAGLGSANPPSAGVGSLTIGGTIFAGALGVLRRVAILVMIPIGMFGAWRLVKPMASRRAQFAALVLYAVVPVPWNALSRGVWDGLVIYAVTPWLLRIVIRILGDRPFDVDEGPDTPRWWSRLLGFAVLLAIVGSVVPAVVAVVVVMAVGLVAGSVLSGRLVGMVRLVAMTAGAVIVACVLTMPWILVGPARSLSALAGVNGGVHGWLDLGRILRFESGPMGAGVIGYGFVVAALLPLVIGRSWRFVWGVRAWGIAGASFTVVWLGQQDWFALPTPPPEVFLALAAIGLALAVACGAAAVEADLPSFRFGWAQAATIISTVALVLVTVPQVANAADGRWKMAPVGLNEAFDFISPTRGAVSSRVLWIGDPGVMPVAGWRLDDHTMLGTSNGGFAEMTELWAPADAGASGALLDAVQLATRSETTRLGRILADMNIRYLVLPRQIVPLPYRSTAHPIPARLLAALDDQLDLARVSANDAAVVYRNDAWRSGLRLYPSGTAKGTSVADAIDAPVGRRVNGSVDPSRSTNVRVAAPGVLATGQPADDSWRLDVAGKAMKPVTLWGWEQGFVVDRAGIGQFSRESSAVRLTVLGTMTVVWLAALAGWFLGRRRGSEDDLFEHEGELASGSLVQISSAAAKQGTVPVEGVRIGDPTSESPDSKPEEKSENVDEKPISSTTEAEDDR